MTEFGQKALGYIQELYAIERKVRKNDLTLKERKQLRLEEALPILNQLAEWMKEEISQVLPKSTISKAIAYSASR